MHTEYGYNAHIAISGSDFWKGHPTFFTGKTRSATTKAVFKVNNIPAKLNRHTKEFHTNEREKARRRQQAAKYFKANSPGATNSVIPLDSPGPDRP